MTDNTIHLILTVFDGIEGAEAVLGEAAKTRPKRRLRRHHEKR